MVILNKKKLNILNIFIVISSFITISTCLPLISFAEFKLEHLRLKLVEVSLLVQTEKIDQAFKILDELKEKLPGHPRILESEANAYYHILNWRKGLKLLNKILESEPENEIVLFRRDETLDARRPFTQFHRETLLRGRTAMEQRIRLRHEAKLNLYSRFGVLFEENILRTRNLRHPNGDIKNFKGTNNRYDFYLTHDYLNGNSYKASIFMGKNIFGLGYKYNWLDNNGITTLEMILQQPTWDYFETSAFSGAKDRISLSRSERIMARLTGNISAGVNRYTLSQDEGLAASATLGTNLTYIVKPYGIAKRIFGKSAQVNMNYIFDSEFVFDVDKRIDDIGRVYKPIPASSRQVHNFNINVDKELSDKFYFKGATGYSYDIYGGKGPVLSAFLTYTPNKKVIVELELGQSISAFETTSTSKRINLSLKYKF